MSNHVQRWMLCCVLVATLTGLKALASGPVVAPLTAYTTPLSSPARIAVDAAGQLIAADPQTGRVVTFDPFGRVVSVRAGFHGPLALGHDAAGHRLVGEAGAGRVRIYDAAWNVVGALGNGDGEFQLPNFLARDPTPGSNTIYVTDSVQHVVKVYHGTTFAFSFGGLGTGPGQFDFPTGVWAATNEVFVVDQNNDRVEVFDRTGTYLREFSLVTRIAPGLFGLAGGRSLGIGGDAAGRLYVADGFQGILKVFDKAGTSLAAVGSLGDALGQLRSPADLCFDPLGRCFVASPNNGRVAVFGIDDYIHLAVSTPADQPLATGLPLSFTASGPGLTNRTLQWQHNVVDVPGETGQVFFISALAAGDAGAYSLQLAGVGGTSIWSTATISVQVPPTIETQPASLAVAAGAVVSLFVTAAGDALRYQWHRSGEPVEGATNAVFTLLSAQESDAGFYQVQVSNEVGWVRSVAATVTVVTPPVVVLQPVDAKAVVGNTAQFDVVAAGSELTFSWRFNGFPLFAPSLPVVTLPDVQPLAAGTYAVVVSNLAGVVTSTVASLSIFVPPATQEVQTIVYEPGLGARIRFVGDSGYRFTLDASLDLSSWTTLTNTALPAGGLELLDSDANASLRFYRMRWHP